MFVTLVERCRVFPCNQYTSSVTVDNQSGLCSLNPINNYQKDFGDGFIIFFPHKDLAQQFYEQFKHNICTGKWVLISSSWHDVLSMKYEYCQSFIDICIQQDDPFQLKLNSFLHLIR